MHYLKISTQLNVLRPRVQDRMKYDTSIIRVTLSTSLKFLQRNSRHRIIFYERLKNCYCGLSAALLTIWIRRRGRDEWRWVTLLAFVFVRIATDLKMYHKHTDKIVLRYILTAIHNRMIIDPVVGLPIQDSMQASVETA